MPRARTLILCWVLLLVAWLGSGRLAVARGWYVHGVWLLGWLLAGAAGALVLLSVTLWWLWRGRTVERR